MRSIHDWFAQLQRRSPESDEPADPLVLRAGDPMDRDRGALGLPVPSSIGKPGLWCALLMVGVLTFYWRLSRPLGAAMIALFIVLALLTNFAYDALGPRGCSGSRSACSSSHGSASSSATRSKGGGRRSSPTLPIS